jgi:hypothetical protein
MPHPFCDGERGGIGYGAEARSGWPSPYDIEGDGEPWDIINDEARDKLRKPAV